MTQTVGWRYALWSMLLVALLLRLVLASRVESMVSQTPGRLCLIAGDAEGYWELAGKIAAGATYSIYDPERRCMRTPGFPALLALPRFVFGNDPIRARFPARILLAVVGTLSCGLTYWLGRELGGDLVGLIAGTYTVISPTMALFSVLFLSETAFAATLLASLIAAAKLVRVVSQANATTVRDSKWLALWTGVLIGVATYMRPTWLLVGPGIAVLIGVVGRKSVGVKAGQDGERNPLTLTLSPQDRGEGTGEITAAKTSFWSRLMPAIWVCVGLGVCMAPWTIRNAIVTGHFIPTTLWVGPSLYDGLNPTATGESDMQFFEDDGLMKFMSEYDMDREYRRRAWAYAAANPGRVVWLALMKQLRYWNPASNSAQFSHFLFRAIAWLAFLPLILFALAGAWFSRHDLWLLILTAAPIFYFAGLHLLFVGSLRYRLPAEYPLAVLASIGFVRCFGFNVNDKAKGVVPFNNR